MRQRVSDRREAAICLGATCRTRDEFLGAAPQMLDQLVREIAALDMDQVRKEIAEQEAADNQGADVDE